VEQSFLSEVVDGEKRTSLTSALGSFAVAGFVLGPALGAALTSVRFSFQLSDADTFKVDGISAPALLVVVTVLVMLVLTAALFDPEAVKREAAAEAQGHSQQQGQGREGEGGGSTGRFGASEAIGFGHAPYVGPSISGA
jgi:MFS family permease